MEEFNLRKHADTIANYSSGFINLGNQTNEELRQQGRKEYREELLGIIDFWERDLDPEDAESHIWYNRFKEWINRIK
jgi:hypothetical protein